MMGDPSHGLAARRYSRRRLLSMAAAVGATALGGCSAASPLVAAPGAPTSTPSPTPTVEGFAAPVATTAPSRTPRPTATPRPVPAAGRETRMLLAGTEWETPAVITHSGVAGPPVIVLGGVHGNEPGGWEAAEAIATWGVLRGSLAVVPRANRLATLVMERTLPELGDLNRLYPGSAEGLPMERMAQEIVQLGRELGAEWLLDLHESWGFYNERGANSGTAFIGQTVAVRDSAEGTVAVRAVVDEVNAGITEREQLTMRDRRRRPSGSFGTGFEGGSWSRRTSLSLGAYVPGMVPVLIEMGQQEQPVVRRAELHQIFTRTVLQHLEMA